jgi:hypothetical protein
MPLLLRRGLEADRLSFTPAEGELIYVTDTKLVYIGDGVTAGGNLLAGGGEEPPPPPPTPTYELSRSIAQVDEGDTFTITLTTTNVVNGTNIPYTITGVSEEDIDNASLTGFFSIVNNTDSITVTTTEDSSTEGPETFTITLNGITPTNAISVTINDTSLTRTYQLDTNVQSVNEGDSFTVTLTTANVPNGTLVPYNIIGISSSDISGASLTGNFTVNSNTATLIVNTTEDSLTEGNETFTIRLTGISPLVFTSVTIVDTSITPPPPEGDVDGGAPDTVDFTSVVDGGTPSTTEFDDTVDGGVLA